MTAPSIDPNVPAVPPDYAERLEFLDFDVRDARLLAEFGQRHAAVAEALVERFYRHLLQFPRLRQLLDEPALKRLKAAQAEHFARLFGGEYGRSFAAQLLRTGATHQRLGVPPAWYLGAYALYLRLLLPAIIEQGAGDPRRTLAYLESVVKAVFLDLGLGVETYFDAKQRDLQALQARADRIVASVPAGLAVLDLDLSVLATNRGFDEVWARDGSPLGRKLPELLGAAALTRHLREVSAGGGVRTGLLLTLRAGGTARPARVAVAPLDGPAGDPAQLLCAIEDLGTELHLAAQVHAADRRFHEVVELSRDAMFLVRADGAVSGCNQAAATLVRVERHEPVGRSFLGLFAAAYHDAVQAALDACAAATPGGAPVGRELLVELQHADGSLEPVALTVRAEHAEGDALCLAMLRPPEVAKPRTASTGALDFRALLELTPSLMLVVRRGLIAWANPAAAALLGDAEPTALVGRELLELVAPADREVAATLLRGAGAATACLIRLRHRDGSLVVLRCAVRPLPGATEDDRVLCGQAAADELVLDERLRRLDRLVPGGTLAAAVARELAEPLERVAVDLRVARSELAQTGAANGAGAAARARLAAALAEAEDGAATAERVIGQVGALTADAESGALVDLRGVLEAVLGLVGPELQARARLETEYGDAPLVEANEPELAQVFLNLLTNAIQAIPPGAPEANFVRVATFGQGREAVIEVSDSGGGIPAELQPHLFEPFFTTRGGACAGLGLAISRRVITACGGAIEVVSTAGAATTFRVRLPGARVGATPSLPGDEVPTVPPLRR